VVYPPLSAARECISDTERDLNRLVFCGRLEESKGAAEAVHVLSLLPGEFYLEVLGDGPQRGVLEKSVSEAPLADRVKFHGWVDAAARDRVLARAGVLLLPSLCDEAFGMAGLESFAQGTPVVAYNVGGVSEWCWPGAGVLVSCGDPPAAARAVLELVHDPTRWQNHSRAAKRVAQEFPPDRFGREWEELLNEVLRGEWKARSRAGIVCRHNPKP